MSSLRRGTLLLGSVAATGEGVRVLTEDPRVGTVISDRYRIVRKIGQGGVGVVFEGEHLLIKRRVAIKCLHPQYAADPATVERFHREAQAVTAIGHPGIVEVLDMSTMPDGSAFLVFELLEGRDLGEEIEARGRLPVDRVIELALEICDAFEATHAAGVIHRDIKPENIFLAQKSGQDRPVVKLLDFGISKVAADSRRFTASESVVGTPHYLSPEQASGKTLDQRTDLYALGVVLYAALSGELPFDADSVPALLMKICTDSPPPIRRVRPDVPASLEAILLRLLAKRREARFASAGELRAALLACREGAPIAPPADEPLVVPTRALRWPLIVVGLAALSITIGVSWLTGSPRPAAPIGVAPPVEPAASPRIDVPRVEPTAPPLAIEAPHVEPSPSLGIEPPAARTLDLDAPPARPRRPRIEEPNVEPVAPPEPAPAEPPPPEPAPPAGLKRVRL